MIDPQSPVIVGVGQVRQKPNDPRAAVEPLMTMTEAVRLAGEDTGRPDFLSRVKLVAVIKGVWHYSDPGRLIAAKVGASGASTALTPNGGQMPLTTLHALCQRISRGELDVGVIVGGEGVWSRRRMRQLGEERALTIQRDSHPDEVIGTPLEMSDAFETERGLHDPIDVYPLFESAIRARRHESLWENRNRISHLWSSMSKVASTNPYAWLPNELTAEDIREPAPANRMVAFPYTKHLTSNWDVDLASAIVVCSAGAAADAGLPPERWVFPWAGVEADDIASVTRRQQLGVSPALQVAWRALREMSGYGLDDIDYLDIYSCFPSAVHAAASALEIGAGRQVTLTGGMTFAGGPLNNYVTHSLATMVHQLRHNGSGVGLLTGNGGYLTRHAIGLFGSRPSAHGYKWRRLAEHQIPVHPRERAIEHRGHLTIEAYTVRHDHEGRCRAIVSGLLPDQRRVLGWSKDRLVTDVLEAEECVGRRAHMSATGEVELE